jgi:DNA-binding transcriptional MocR family regulator
MTPDAQNRAYQQMETLLYQTDLMNCKDPNQLTDDMLSNIVEQAKGRLAPVLPDPNILITSMMHDSLRLLVKGVIERDSKNNDILTYLSARTELERSANRAHEMLWKRFVESTGYQP